VTYMTWNKENEDILAVSYGESKYSAGSGINGLILCWSVKNPEVLYDGCLCWLHHCYSDVYLFPLVARENLQIYFGYYGHRLLQINTEPSRRRFC
jgi:hypothetical protein